MYPASEYEIKKVSTYAVIKKVKNNRREPKLKKTTIYTTH